MTIPARINVKTVSAVLYAVLLLQPSQGFSANVACGEAIKELDFGQQLSLDPQVLDQKIQNLAELKLALDLAKVEGASTVEITAMLANYEMKELEAVKYLENNKIMTRERLIEKIKSKIEMLQEQNRISQQGWAQERDQEARRKKTQDDHIKNKVVDGTRAIFHRIEAGTIRTVEVGSGVYRKFSDLKEIEITISKDFDMMATLTTQRLYEKIAILANTKFPDRDKIIVDPSHFKGALLPVESVSYKDVQLWLKALNDLSQAGEQLLFELIPEHKNGDVYRLPTEDEWEFVHRGRGALKGRFYFGDNEADLKNHAWFSENANGTTHPVAEKLPLVFEGKDFYDMLGNVDEWLADAPDRVRRNGSGLAQSYVRGGNYGTFGVLIMDINANLTGASYFSTGFRIVRDVK